MKTDSPTGKLLRRASCLFATLLAWLFTVQALADGKVFPATAFPADVKIPDQSALLIWSKGVERLVIETRFIGEGTNFAWVVPLPTVPEIEPATTGLFPTLRYCLRPELVHSAYSFWAVGIFVSGLVWLLATVRRDQPRRVADLLACLVTAGGFAVASHSDAVAVFGGPIMFLLLLVVANRVRGGKERVFAFLLAVVMVFVLAAMLLPALAKGGAAAPGENSGVNVLDRRIVGAFDTTTITAKEADALHNWLKGNGYAVSAEAKPVIEQHIREGWVFVATKVHRDATNAAPATPHPLSFTFKAPKPVYPLRLTGVGSGDLAVELFVVGPERAHINGFKTTECHVIDAAGSDGKWRFGSKYRRIIGHEQLRSWARGAAVITRLEARLQPADMKQDAQVTWGKARSVTSHLYSRRGAAQTAANWTVSVAGIAILIAALLAHFGRLQRRKAVVVGLAAAGVAGMVALSIYLFLPKVPVRMQRWPGMMANMNMRQLGIQSSTSYPTNQPVDLESVRKHVSHLLAQGDSRWTKNVLLGGLIREEDSPGNYTLRETPEGVEILGYDATGASVSFGTVPKSP